MAATATLKQVGRPSMRPMVAAKFKEALKSIGGRGAISIDDIADMAGVSWGTARSAILELRERGEVKVTEGRPNTYTLSGKPGNNPVKTKIVEPHVRTVNIEPGMTLTVEDMNCDIIIVKHEAAA
jgi:hypothetical protein